MAVTVTLKTMLPASKDKADEDSESAGYCVKTLLLVVVSTNGV